jgi:hypothetical protein
MPDEFTHKFEIDMIDYQFKGECEFNTDGKVTYKITDSSDVLPLKLNDWFYKFMNFASELYHEVDGVTGLLKLSIKKKE